MSFWASFILKYGADILGGAVIVVIRHFEKRRIKKYYRSKLSQNKSNSVKKD